MILHDIFFFHLSSSPSLFSIPITAVVPFSICFAASFLLCSSYRPLRSSLIMPLICLLLSSHPQSSSLVHIIHRYRLHLLPSNSGLPIITSRSSSTGIHETSS